MLTLVALSEQIFPFSPYSLRQYLSLKWEHNDWPDSKFTSLGRLPDQRAPGIFLFPPWVLGIGTEVSMLLWHVLYLWNYLPKTTSGFPT